MAGEMSVLVGTAGELGEHGVSRQCDADIEYFVRAHSYSVGGR